MWQVLRKRYPTGDGQITIYGEFIGGAYPSVGNDGYKRVQKGVYYAADHRFYAFDAWVEGVGYLGARAGGPGILDAAHGHTGRTRGASRTRPYSRASAHICGKVRTRSTSSFRSKNGLTSLASASKSSASACEFTRSRSVLAEAIFNFCSR